MTFMSDKKRGLGRGLEALLGEAKRRPEPDVPAAREQLMQIPVDLLSRGKYQRRVDMREESLADLADSIKAQGVIQPIVVRPVGAPTPGEPQRYEIVAGERRWRAAQMAGLHEIPAVLRRIDDEHAVALALIENIQREDLNPLEEALALSRLISEFQLTHQQVAEAVGRSRAAVSNLLRLLDLPQAIRPFIEKRELEMGHARALLSARTRAGRRARRTPTSSGSRTTSPTSWAQRSSCSIQRPGRASSSSAITASTSSTGFSRTSPEDGPDLPETA
jgi:ParB family chromosome partitioning protein